MLSVIEPTISAMFTIVSVLATGTNHTLFRRKAKRAPARHPISPGNQMSTIARFLLMVGYCQSVA